MEPCVVSSYFLPMSVEVSQRCAGVTGWKKILASKDLRGKLTLDNFFGTGPESDSPSQIWIEAGKVKLWKRSSECLTLSMPLGSH